MRQDAIELDFPTGGIDRRWGYQRQAPYTTPDCRNVLPFDSAEGRARGGSRPGTRKGYANSLGGAVRLMAELDYVPDRVGSTLQWFEENFESDGFGARWSTASWLSNPLVIRDGLAAATAGNGEGGVVLTSLSMDTSNAYTVGVYVAPHQHAFHGIYRIFARMSDSSPDATDDGIIAELGMVGDSLVARLYNYSSGSLANSWTYAGVPQGHADGGWFRVYVTGTTVALYWRDTLLTSQTVSAAAGQRVGFGATCLTPSGQALIDAFRVWYRKTETIPERRRALVVSAAGYVWSDDWATIGGTLGTPISETLNLSSTKDLTAAQYGQKLYVADRGVLLEGTCSTSGTSFDDATVADWTAAGLDTSHRVVITASLSGTTAAGTYTIGTIASGNLTLGSSAGTGTGTYYIERLPKIYNRVGVTKLSSWVATSGKGTVPMGGEICVRYRERMVLAGGALGIQWYMSRQGDPLDWLAHRTPGDVGRPIYGAVADAGVPGDVITAVAPAGDEYLAMFCPTSTWRIVGDPADTGQIQAVHRGIGCIGARAWCNGEAGEVYFLSRVGLCRLDRDGSVTRLSAERVPRELIDIDTMLYSVSLAYDPRELRVYVFIADSSTNRSTTHWAYDLRTGGFWPVVLPWDMQPVTSMWFNSPAPKESGLLLGGRDGYVRRFDEFCDTDDGRAMDAYMDIGPVSLGDGIHDGMIESMYADVAADSRNVEWDVRVGANAESAAKATAAVSGEWAAGANPRTIVRRRGNACVVRVGRDGLAQGWGLERLTLVRARLGRRRLL